MIESNDTWRHESNDVDIGTLRWDVLDKMIFDIKNVDDLIKRMEDKRKGYWCHLMCERQHFIEMMPKVKQLEKLAQCLNWKGNVTG